MALRDILKPKIFRDAALNVAFRSRRMEWSGTPIKTVAAVLLALAERAPRQADQTDQDTMKAVNEAMQRFYPRHERWDDPALQKLLNENTDLLELCGSEEAISAIDLEGARSFVEEFSVALSALEARNHRNGCR